MRQKIINYIERPREYEVHIPDEAIEPIIPFIPKGKAIWDCTNYGKSNITRILRKNRYRVITEINKRTNILTDIPNFDFGAIVAVPPYPLRDEFLDKCYAYDKPFALLMPMITLSGSYASKLFKEFGIELLVLNKCIKFVLGIHTYLFNAGWFCKGLLPKPLMFV